MQGHEDFLNATKTRKEAASHQPLVISKNKKPQHFCRGCIKNQLMIILLMQPVA